MTKRLFALLIGVLLCGLSLYAQVNATGSLQGTVLDPTGAVVPNADVKISNKDTGLARSMKSNGSGLYRFELLPAGTYTLIVTMTGFSTATFQNVGVAVSQTNTIDVTLSPSSQATTVTVESTGAPLVDTDKTDVSLPITTRQIEDLPLNGRDFANLAFLAPGAKPVDSYDPTKNRTSIFAVNGSSGRNVNVTVNGIDNKDNTVGGPVMQLPLEAIQEFNISTQRFSAANGRSEGAAISVITKSGTNSAHGTVYFFDRNEALNTNDAISIANGQDKPPYSRQQFGGAIGGPVRKDKDFLFFSLERQREATSIPVDGTAYKELSLVTAFGAQPATVIPTPYFDWRYLGRYDHRFNDKHSLFISYANQNNRGENDQSGSTNDLTAGNFTTNQLILANMTVNSVLTPSVVNAFTAGYQYWNNLIDSNLKVPTYTFPGGITFGTNTNVPQQSYQVKWQFRDDLSITKGKHNFRMGFDYLWEPKLGGFFEFNPTLEVDFADLPSKILSDKVTYPQGFATPGAVTSMSATSGNPYFNLPGGAKMFGMYFQDNWKVSRRLTVNLGLRWDKDYNLIGGSDQAINRTYLQLKAIGSPYAGALPHDDNKDFSPRIGFAYDLTGKGRDLLRGGAGIYYGQTFLNIPLFMLQQLNPTLFATVLSIGSSGPGTTCNPAQSDVVPNTGKSLCSFRYGIDPLPNSFPAITQFQGGEVGRLMDPAYHNPYTEQFNIGYSHEFDSANVVEIEYIHSLGLRESKTTDINPKFNGGARILNAAFTAKGLPTLTSVQVEQSVGRSRYDGMNVSYRRRLSHHFSLNTSYVLSRSLAYNGSAASFRNRPSDVNNLFRPEDLGPTPSDSTHRFVVSGIIELPWGFMFTTFLQAESARPYNATQGIDVIGQGRASVNHAVLLKSDPNNYKATAAYTVAQAQSCLAAGNCIYSGFDSLRGTPFFQWDARISKAIRFGERAKLDLIAQFFDLTNRANYGNNYNGAVRSSSFGTPQGYITPSGVTIPHSFSAELGAQFRF
ncbi:MAG TPA: carboxypeptidase regulatory-like domain-containing protein [Bryobacteraceae bacterium]|nr:carboxypeptidase regulatory-like domain-containing protein [Bryobacteraceae bacterium]